MSYVFNEGTLQFPTPPTDRSINVLIVADPDQGLPLNLVITRDEMEPGETLEECVKRQMKLLSRQYRGFAELKRTPAQIGTPNIAGVVTETKNSNGGNTVYQLQAIFPISERGILIFTLSASKPFNEAQRQVWSGILASYNPAAQA